MSYMDDFIHRLNMIPPQADQLLRQIRALDREVEQLRLDLDPRRQAFLANLHRWTDKRATKIKAEA
jgi:F0F1-type ATP synthase membrane subunit b/b'